MLTDAPLDRWFPFAAQSLWQATLLLLAAALLVRTTRSPRARAAIADAALAMVLVMPCVSALSPHYVWHHTEHLLAWLPLIEASAFTSPQGSTYGPRLIAVSLAAVWLTGGALGLVALLADAAQLVRILRRSRPFRSRRARALLQRVLPGADVQFRLVPGLMAPACWQFQRPLILLPPAILRLPQAELALILRHELGHLRFGHALRLLIARLAKMVFWFHPLVHWTYGRALLWREAACDDWAVRQPAERRRYALLLTELALCRSSRRPAAGLALRLPGSATGLHQRVLRLLDGSDSLAAGREIAPRSRLGAAAIVVLAAVLSVFRCAGDLRPLGAEHWTPWPRATASMLDLAGIEVIDYEPYRYRVAPQEQRPEHRFAHRQRWQRQATGTNVRIERRAADGRARTPLPRQVGDVPGR